METSSGIIPYLCLCIVYIVFLYMINNNKANIATEQTLVLSVIFCLFEWEKMLRFQWHATLWMLSYRSYWAPNTVFEHVPDIQPWCRITATTSQSHNELSTNVLFFKRRVKVEGGGVALSSLLPRNHARFTVDVSQWRGAHRLWP